MAKEKEEDIQKTLQEIRETHKRMKELVIQQEELQKEIEKRDKEKWILENPEYQETYKMMELAKKAEAGKATEEETEILRQWAEKSLESYLVYEDSVVYAGDGGNTSDEDFSGKEGKAKEGKASESPSSSTSSSVSSLSNSTSSSTSTALPEEIINLASIREVYAKFKVKEDDWDTDDEDAWNLQDKYFQYLDILRKQLNDRESGKDKIEKILEEFYKDCASNELAETDFGFLYYTHNPNLIKMSLLNLAARIDKDSFVKMLSKTADIEMYFQYFLQKQKEGQFNQIEFNESIKNQQEKVQSVINEVAKALKISIDVTPESQSSSTSSSVSSLSESTISEVTISSVLPEIAVITDSGGSSELSGDSAETGEHLAG
jgi:hypothetical protein